MLYGKKILVVVPARGGSKGVPKKNIYPILGKPLIAYTAQILEQMDFFDEAILSTDCSEIAKVAEGLGLVAPFLRPKELASDVTGDLPVIEHALVEMERLHSCIFDYVVMLQATCPLRYASTVQEAVEKCVSQKLDSVWSVSQVDLKYHPLKQLQILGGTLELFDQRGFEITARQQLLPTYYRTGEVYVIARDCVLNQRAMLGKKSGYVVSTTPQISIDTIQDIEIVEKLLRSRQVV